MRPSVPFAVASLCVAIAAPTATACPTGGQTPTRGPSVGKVHGNGKLWAGIPRSGVVTARPASERRMPVQLADGAIRDKVLHVGALPRDGKLRKLVIKGKRIDGEAEPFRVVRSGGRTQRNLYWPGYITYATPGCWKIAASFGRGTRLAYILDVRPPPEPEQSRR